MEQVVVNISARMIITCLYCLSDSFVVSATHQTCESAPVLGRVGYSLGLSATRDQFRLVSSISIKVIAAGFIWIGLNEADFVRCV